MSRFFVDPAQVSGGQIRLTDRDDLKHLRKVLRLSVGDELDVSDGQSWEYRVEILGFSEDEAVLRILDKQKFAREPHLQVTLFQGIPKGAKMEEIIQKSVELGVHAVVPVFMARTIVVDRGNFDKKLARWQKISDEAVKQCKRGIIPQVERPLQFAQLTAALEGFDLILFPYENEEQRTIKDCLRELTAQLPAADAAEGKKAALPQTVAILIGPEGGFSDAEAALLDACGAQRVSLGRTILRTETAGPAALAMTMYELEL